jgi:hypothetical protein
LAGFASAETLTADNRIKAPDVNSESAAALTNPPSSLVERLQKRVEDVYGRKQYTVDRDTADQRTRAASLRAEMYIDAATAAVVPSPTAVAICLVSCERTSPTAQIPSTEVCMLRSVRM